jgi:hypothetical protein
MTSWVEPCRSGPSYRGADMYSGPLCCPAAVLAELQCCQDHPTHMGQQGTALMPMRGTWNEALEWNWLKLAAAMTVQEWA